MKKAIRLLIVLIAAMWISPALALDSYTPYLNLVKPERGSSGWLGKFNINSDRLDDAWLDFHTALTDLPEVYQLPGTFNGPTGVVISLPKAVDATDDYFVSVQPTSYAGVTLGDIKVVNGLSSFTVYCENANTSDTFIAAVHYETDLATYGNQVFRRWIVSPDVAITDHCDASQAGSIANILVAMDGAFNEIVLPGAKTYKLKWTKAYYTTATGMTFTASTRKIAKTGAGFATSGFVAGMPIHVSGTVSNDDWHKIESVNDNEIVVVGDLIDETVTTAAVEIMFAIPNNATFTFDRGSNLSDDSTGKTLWWNGGIVHPGNYKIFNFSGNIYSGPNAKTDYFSPEMCGAIGNYETDDRAKINQCINAAPAGIPFRFTSSRGYRVVPTATTYSDPPTNSIVATRGTGIVLHPTKYLYYEGYATTIGCDDFPDNDASCVSLTGSMATDTIKGRVTGLKILNMDEDHTGIGYFFKGNTHWTHDDMYVSHFDKDIWLYQDSSTEWNETNFWRHIKTQNANFCWYLSKSGTAGASMSTQVWDDCLMSPRVANGISFYLGAGVSLYRCSYNMTSFNGTDGSIAYYIDGKLINSHGFMNIEGQASKTGSPDNKGFYFGPNSLQSNFDIGGSHFGVNGGAYLKHASAPTPGGLWTNSEGYRTMITWPGEETKIVAYRDGSIDTTHQIEALTSESSTTTRMKVTGHNLYDGDEITFGSIDQTCWDDLNGNDYRVTRVDADYVDFTYDSRACSAYAPSTDDGYAMFQIYRYKRYIYTNGNVRERYRGRLQILDDKTGLQGLIDATPVYETGIISTDLDSVGGVIDASHVDMFRFTPGTSSTLKKIDGGEAGRIIWLQFGDGNTVVSDETGKSPSGDYNISLSTAMDFTPSTGSIMALQYVGASSKWMEYSWVPKNDKMGTFAQKGSPESHRNGDVYMCTDCQCGGSSGVYPIFFYNNGSGTTNWYCGNGDASPTS